MGRRLLVVHEDLILNHAPFQIDVTRPELGVQVEVGEQVCHRCGVRSRGFDMVAGMFLGRESIERATDGFSIDRDPSR